MAMDLDLSNQVVVSPAETAKHLPRRTLDLSNIQTQELKLLAPLGSEMAPKGQVRSNALLSYSERLRNSYRAEDGGLRDGMLLLGETLKNGQAIVVSCSCRSGEMCHADVVKMAIEKVHDRLQLREAAERQPVRSTQVSEGPRPNPRTQRAINEIFSVTKSDLLLSRIDKTDGRSQNEHASFLNQHSQFTRDLYEHGATAREGAVIVPKERLSVPPTLHLITNEYAVKKLEQILQDKAKSTDLAPKLVEYGKQIAGTTADRETQMKVFNWIYRSLEGKSQFLDSAEQKLKDESKEARFERTIHEIANLAQELNVLESRDQFVSLDELSRNNNSEMIKAEHGHEDNNSSEKYVVELEIDMAPPIQPEFDRIEVGNVALARMASEMESQDLNHWFDVRLPAIDRELETGKPITEILNAYKDNIYLAFVHKPSSKQAAIEDLRFASAYIDHQLKHPESRLRHFNPRYRKYAELLEKTLTRGEVVEAASKIRAENARVGLGWDKLPEVEKARTFRPLTSKEMQFLFTEVSPTHYTSDMTIARLAYSHAGASREIRTDALMKGEIRPSQEAEKLVESLESRLERRYLNDSLGATKHFLQSLKTPNQELRYRNDFDHKALYLKLSPPEKDFIYQRAILQKESLEARSQSNAPKEKDIENLSRLRDSISESRFATLRNGLVSELVEVLKKAPEVSKSDLVQQTGKALENLIGHSDTLNIKRNVGLSDRVGGRNLQPAEKFENEKDSHDARNHKTLDPFHSYGPIQR